MKLRRSTASAVVLGLPLLACATLSEPDPLEPVNRGVFWFNDGADRYVVEPLATGWDIVVPAWVQHRISDFFDHVAMPRVFANDLLQLKGEAAAYDLVRVVTNSIFGFAGFYDVASREGVPKNDEDFGQTLGYWGMPPGPYLMLPILGPSTLRDAAGRAFESFLVGPYRWFIDTWPLVGATAVEALNFRASVLEEVRENRREAYDYYAFVRSAYLQNRRMKVEDSRTGGGGGSSPDEDLYYFDDDSGGGDAGADDQSGAP